VSLMCPRPLPQRPLPDLCCSEPRLSTFRAFGICRSRWLLTSMKRRRYDSTPVISRNSGLLFYKDRFLCRAISAELASETIPLRDLIRVRNQRRKELRSILLDRQKMFDTLLLLKKGPTTDEPRVKQYRNE
jgi:hypothetical protein